MALKADRHELQTDISFFMNEGATRGAVAVFSTGGSGAAMDQSAALVTLTVASGAMAAGLLLNDMVDIDLTRQHINWHKDEVAKGGKVTLLRKGWVVTNSLYTGSTAATIGAKAYVNNDGMLTADSAASYASGTGQVGVFLSTIDEDGYAKVSIDL